MSHSHHPNQLLKRQMLMTLGPWKLFLDGSHELLLANLLEAAAAVPKKMLLYKKRSFKQLAKM